MSGVSFTGFLLPLRFNDNANFQHWLDIFDSAATDVQCEILGNPGLENTALQNVSNAIANTFMDKIDTKGGKWNKGHKEKGVCRGRKYSVRAQDEIPEVIWF